MTFEPPEGYTQAQLSDASVSDDTEIWVIRVPEGVDASQLDGVQVPLSSLAADHARVLATARVSPSEAYDVRVAQATSAAPKSSTSQLIDMAAPTSDSFALLSDARGAHWAGLAAELLDVAALVPKNNRLRLGT